MEPLCSRDGKLIYFVSDRDGERSRNAYAGANDRELWAFDTRTQQERRVWQTSNDDGLHLHGIAADGGVLIEAGMELRNLSARHPWRIEKIDSASVSPDGRTLAAVIAGSVDKEGQSHDSKLYLVDTATGRSRAQLGAYSAPAWSPDGARIAAIADDGIAVLDVATRKIVARTGWPRTDPIPESLIWSPDGSQVLAGLHGENGGAGDPQSDYFLLNIASGKWTPALTAQDLVWLPGGHTVVYIRPVATTPLAAGSPHSVWTSDLAAFELMTHKDTPLSTGLVLNDYLAACLLR